MRRPLPPHRPNGQDLIEGLLELAYPTRCAVCEKPGALLCEHDREALALIDLNTACPRCSAPFGRELCTECMTREGPVAFSFSAAVSALVYDQRAEALIVAYKDDNERRLAVELAGLLSRCIPRPWLRWADGLTWVPADLAARQRRGFDHIELFAGELSRQLGLAGHPLLAKQSGGDQRALGRAGRQANVGSLFSLAGDSAAMPRRLLLVDDVFTTGSTLDAAASVLLAGGATEVRVATLARVW